MENMGDKEVWVILRISYLSIKLQFAEATYCYFYTYQPGNIVNGSPVNNGLVVPDVFSDKQSLLRRQKSGSSSSSSSNSNGILDK